MKSTVVDESLSSTQLQFCSRENQLATIISKWLLNGKAPKHEADLFTHIKGLVQKYVIDTNQKFMALIIPKAWKYTVLVEAYDKLGHQGVTHRYCLIK